MTDLVFLRPWLTLLALGLLALILWRLASDRRVGSWTAAIDPHLMAAMSSIGRISGQGLQGELKNPLLWALALMVPCLAGPALSVRDAAAYRNLDGVVLVIDLSPSVLDGGHLAPLVTMGRSVLQVLGSRPAGMVVYAGDAYVASELTADTRQIEYTLELLDSGTIPDKGSRPALGLDRALGLLESNQTLRSDVIWLTDGGGTSTIDAAKIGARLGGLGGRLTIVHPGTDPAPELAALATALGAETFAASAIVAATAHVADIAGNTLARSDLRLLSFRELGPFFLIPAALCLLLWFRRPA